MTVIKSRRYNYIFGGFTTFQWNGILVYDSDAFIFSLVNAYNTPVKMSKIYGEKAIVPDPSNGPSFGGYDIELLDNSNITASYSYIESYQLPSFTQNNEFLIGSSKFLADEIEVYALDGINLYIFHKIKNL